MSDDEEDYLSDKFLASLEPLAKSTSKTYSDRRKDAQRRGERLHQENRIKSRREREAEAREEALSKTLFERAGEDTGGSKALAMMMKMGFKPGQALGQKDEPPVAVEEPALKDDASNEEPTEATSASNLPKRLGHRTEPLPLNEWMGKKGIGLGKRALSPSAIENLAKAAKHSESTDIDTFRNRTREGYQERQAEGRLRSAQRTCVSQDAEAGVTFNVFWLDPEAPDSFPRGFLDAMEEDAYTLAPLAVRQRALDDIQARTRLDMEAAALQPLQPLDAMDDPSASVDPADKLDQIYDEDTISRAGDFLRLPATDRLPQVLQYLREKYHYCFWCGTRYASEDELKTSCPGSEEDDHD